jgi:hypothetical protein
MITATEINEWEDNFKLADKVIERKKRGIPADRWATTNELHTFVDTCAVAIDCITVLLEENDRLKKQIHKIGLDAMGLSDDTETTRSV